MFTLLLSPALSVATLFPVPPVPAAALWEVQADQDPPGLVALEGGTTFIGSSKKDIEALIKEMPGVAWRKLRSLDSTTPQHRVTVAPFHMGLTEVTNEQYAVFVMATGHRPPEEWGDVVIAAAQAEFLSAEGRRRADAREKGEPIPERREFQRDVWWLANWKQSTWAIPENADLKPVTYVDYADVQAYCQWAGVRLPTEFEYQRACRGTSKNPFPWGTEWEDAKYCATSEYKRVNATFLVGSFEDGASAEGLLDLAGNAWEWTSSSYGPYPGFKRNKYKLDRKTENLPQPRWDGNQRVTVGGSWQNSSLAARCTTRRPTDRTQMTNAVGFRLAASLAVGVDQAQALFDTQVRNSEARPQGVVYAPQQAVAWDRWETAPGSQDAPEGYGVIAGYEYILFVPIEQLEQSNDAIFARETLKTPQHMGFLSLSVPMLEPALPAGTYLIAFRAKGNAIAPDTEVDPDVDVDPDQEEIEFEDPLAGIIDVEQDNLLLFDALTGELVTHMPLEGAVFGKHVAGGELKHLIRTIQVEDPDSKKDPKEMMDIEEDWFELRVQIATKLRNRGFPIRIMLKPEPRTFERKWRKSPKKGK